MTKYLGDLKEGDRFTWWNGDHGVVLRPGRSRVLVKMDGEGTRPASPGTVVVPVKEKGRPVVVTNPPPPAARTPEPKTSPPPGAVSLEEALRAYEREKKRLTRAGKKVRRGFKKEFLKARGLTLEQR